MCLLVTQSSTSPQLTAEWLHDFYDSNADGVGVMYAQSGVLTVEKLLPKTAEEFVDFYRTHIHGKDCAFHLRMKTHGHIDLENCHPYEVLNMRDHGVDMWLMHNGILHTDNKADITKSDTWHYIRDFLRPMLGTNPDFAFHPAFKTLISEHIGNTNKFVLMDNYGRQVVINEEEGVYWGGRWLSNTYAWNAPVSVSKSTEADKFDMGLAHTQIATSPVKYSPVKRYGSYSYADYEYDGEIYGGYSAGYNALDAMSDQEMDIDDLLIELDIGNFRKAGSTSRRQANSFVDKFGFDSFSEICYMLLDGEITEDWFVRIVSDFAVARECFPWLESEAKKNVWTN